MKLLHKPIQRKLSAVLGAQVTFDKLNISLLGGFFDAHGVLVAGDDANSPVLTIKRVRAEISLASVLKGEISVRSVIIERPVFSLVRRADGKTNLPRPIKDSLEPEDPVEAPDDEATSEEEGTEEKDRGEGRWRFDVRKIQLIDGEAHFRVERDVRDGNHTAYHASAEKIMAEVTHRDDAFDITVLVDNIGRRDQPTELGSIKLTGKLTDVEDLSKISEAGLTANLDAGEYLKAKLDCDSLRARNVQFEAIGAADLGRLWLFVPPGIPALKRFEQATARGRIELTARGSYDPTDGLRVPDLTIRAADVALDPGAW